MSEKGEMAGYLTQDGEAATLSQLRGGALVLPHLPVSATGAVAAKLACCTPLLSCSTRTLPLPDYALVWLDPLVAARAGGDDMDLPFMCDSRFFVPAQANLLAILT